MPLSSYIVRAGKKFFIPLSGVVRAGSVTLLFLCDFSSNINYYEIDVKFSSGY